MNKFVDSQKHFMGLSRFSAPHKPVKCKGNYCTCYHHLVSFFQFPSLLSAVYFFYLFFSTPHISCLLHFFPSISFLLLPVPLLPSFPSASLPSHLFLLLCFRLVLSSLYYIVAVGESVCDSNLSCPIISFCSVAEL